MNSNSTDETEPGLKQAAKDSFRNALSDLAFSTLQGTEVRCLSGEGKIVITRKTPAFIIDDLGPERDDSGKTTEAREDDGDIATPEPAPPPDDDRPLD